MFMADSKMKTYVPIAINSHAAFQHTLEFLEV